MNTETLKDIIGCKETIKKCQLFSFSRLPFRGTVLYGSETKESPVFLNRYKDPTYESEECAIIE